MQWKEKQPKPSESVSATRAPSAKLNIVTIARGATVSKRKK